MNLAQGRIEKSPLPQGSLASLAPSAPVPQERLEAARQALSEARKQNCSLGEQVQTVQGELSDLELQRVEAEGQLQQMQEVRARVGPFSFQDSETLKVGWGPFHLSQPHPNPVLSLLGEGIPTTMSPGLKYGIPIIEMEKLRPREGNSLASGDSPWCGPHSYPAE